MYITDHGDGHARLRSGQEADDIVDLIQVNAVVSLGTREQYEYLLYHSHPRRTEKIAVVAHDRSVLVSVWDWDFGLPEGVQTPTEAARKEVRRLYRAFAFRRLVAVPASSASPVISKIRIEVRDGLQTAHVHLCDVSLPHPSSRTAIIDAVWDYIRWFAEIVEAHLDKVCDEVRYRLVPFTSDGYRHAQLTLTHAMVRQKLSAAS